MLTFPQAKAFNSFSSPLWHMFLGQAKKAMSSANTSDLPTSDRNERHVPKHRLGIAPSTVSVLPVTIRLPMAINLQ